MSGTDVAYNSSADVERLVEYASGWTEDRLVCLQYRTLGNVDAPMVTISIHPKVAHDLARELDLLATQLLAGVPLQEMEREARIRAGQKP